MESIDSQRDQENTDARALNETLAQYVARQRSQIDYELLLQMTAPSRGPIPSNRLEER